MLKTMSYYLVGFGVAAFILGLADWYYDGAILGKDCNKTSVIYIKPQCPEAIDSLNALVLNMQHKADSISAISDSLAARLLHCKLTIRNAKYYLNIANRKPSQDKFLKGWMNRALNE